jgi:hypothetical protein
LNILCAEVQEIIHDNNDCVKFIEPEERFIWILIKKNSREKANNDIIVPRALALNSFGPRRDLETFQIEITAFERKTVSVAGDAGGQEKKPLSF